MDGILRIALKVKLHPLFFLSLLLYALTGGVLGYLIAFVAVTIHEFAHGAMARLVGAEDIAITLMPYGAMMRTKGEMPHFGAVLFAGPVAGLIVASASLSACWIFPELYGYLKDFIVANAVIATVNLFPAYPLDGGRLFRLLFPGRWARLLTSLCTLLFGMGAVVLFLVFHRIGNLIFGLFMLSYFFAFCLIRANRRQASDPLYALAKTDEEGRFLPAIVKEGGKKLCRIGSSEVTRFCLTYPPECPIAEVLEREKARRDRI